MSWAPTPTALFADADALWLTTAAGFLYRLAPGCERACPARFASGELKPSDVEQVSAAVRRVLLAR